MKGTAAENLHILFKSVCDNKSICDKTCSVLSMCVLNNKRENNTKLPTVSIRVMAQVENDFDE